MKGDGGLVAVGPAGDKGGGGGVGGGGGGGNPAQQQAVTNGQMQMANGEPNTQNATTSPSDHSPTSVPVQVSAASQNPSGVEVSQQQQSVVVQQQQQQQQPQPIKDNTPKRLHVSN